MERRGTNRRPNRAPSFQFKCGMVGNNRPEGRTNASYSPTTFFRDQTPPQIDPRRYQHPPPSTGNNNNIYVLPQRRFAYTRYVGTVKDFSNQLPVRRGNWLRQPNLPSWSRGGTHSRSSNGIGTSDQFRAPHRPLKDMDSDNWAENITANESLSTEDSAVKIQDKVWQSFVDRDNYMDEVKKFNASNLAMLKEKRDKTNGESPITDFDTQILSYVANPGHFPATWKLLKMIYDEKTLNDYVEKRNYTESELNSSKFSQDLLDSLLDVEDVGEQGEGTVHISEGAYDHNGAELSSDVEASKAETDSYQSK